MVPEGKGREGLCSLQQASVAREATARDQCTGKSARIVSHRTEGHSGSMVDSEPLVCLVVNGVSIVWQRVSNFAI